MMIVAENRLPLLISLLSLIKSSASLKCKQCGHPIGLEYSFYFKQQEAFKCDEEVSWDCDDPWTTTTPPPPPIPTDPNIPNPPGPAPAAGAAPPSTSANTNQTSTTTTTTTTTTTESTSPTPPIYRDMVQNDPTAPWACESHIAAGGIMRRCLRTHEKMGCKTIGESKRCVCNDKDDCNDHEGNGSSSRTIAGGLLLLSLPFYLL